jgi:hypothetical protein
MGRHNKIEDTPLMLELQQSFKTERGGRTLGL